MTCTRIGNVIVCTHPWARLKLGNRYVWMEFHPYCGPSFYWDSNGHKLYDPENENDPIWPVFGVWLDKYNASLAKAAKAKLKAAKAKLE